MLYASSRALTRHSCVLVDVPQPTASSQLPSQTLQGIARSEMIEDNNPCSYVQSDKATVNEQDHKLHLQPISVMETDAINHTTAVPGTCDRDG